VSKQNKNNSDSHWKHLVIKSKQHRLEKIRLGSRPRRWKLPV